jgi:hypothetical protein
MEQIGSGNQAEYQFESGIFHRCSLGWDYGEPIVCRTEDFVHQHPVEIKVSRYGTKEGFLIGTARNHPNREKQGNP